MKRLFNLCLFLFICASTFAQGAEKYRSVYLGLGPRSLDTDEGIISTTFTDNSPSMDFFQDDFQVEDGYSRLGLQLGFKWGRYNGLSHSIGFDVSFGEHSGLGVLYSIGWSKTIEMADGWLTFRPALFGGFANYGFGIGQIDNNAGYIQIGNTEYYDPYLDLSLKSQVGLFGPELDIVYGFNDHFEVWLIGNYDIGTSNAKPKLEFSSPADDGGSSSLEIAGDNPLVTYNGEKMTELPYSVGGVRLTLGVSYVWQRD